MPGNGGELQRPTPESDSKDSEMIYDFCETNVICRNKVRRGLLVRTNLAPTTQCF